MIKFLLRKFIARHKEILYREASLIQDFMYILFKRVNRGEKWTRDEKRQLKLHLIHLSGYIPVLIIFLLPGGSLLLPLFAEVLDRRRKKRDKGAE
jgi:hypothetical protein